MIQGYTIVNGIGTANNGAADGTVIAAQGANKTMRVLKGYVTVTVAAVGGSGQVALEDGVGGTSIFRTQADSLGHYIIDFGDEGYPLSTNTLLNLTVDSAVTTQATARATLICKVV